MPHKFRLLRYFQQGLPPGAEGFFPVPPAGQYQVLMSFLSPVMPAFHLKFAWRKGKGHDHGKKHFIIDLTQN